MNSTKIIRIQLFLRNCLLQQLENLRGFNRGAALTIAADIFGYKVSLFKYKH